MAGVSVRIDAAQMRSRLKAFTGRVQNIEPAARSFGERMLRITDERFSGEHDPEGRPWVPLSPLTLAGSYKKQTFTRKGRITKGYSKFLGGRKILTASHRLRRSITYTAGHRSLALGTNVVYGRIHQLGGMAGRGRKVRIPARPFLGFNQQDVQAFIDEIKNHLEAGR